MNNWNVNHALVEGEAPAEPARAVSHGDRLLPDGWHDPRRAPSHNVEPLRHHQTIVFVTVCTKGRTPWLASPDVQTRLLDVWADSTKWAVGKYVLMPDHLHLFACWIGDVPLSNWVQYWKSRYSKLDKCADHIWQTGYWDTTMRSYDQYVSKWEYVLENPVRHGLVESAKDWPFAGEINQIEWT